MEHYRLVWSDWKEKPYGLSLPFFGTWKNIFYFETAAERFQWIINNLLDKNIHHHIDGNI